MTGVRSKTDIHGDVGSALQLGPAVDGAGDIKGVGAAASDLADFQAGGFAGGLGFDHGGQGTSGRRFALGAVHDADGVALVAHQAHEVQAGGGINLLRQDQGGFTRQDAAAVHADLDLNDDAKGDAAGDGGLGQLAHVTRVVHGNGDSSPASEIAESRDLDGADDLVGDQHVANAAVHHGFGLADLGAGDAGRAGLDLHEGDTRRFVVLDVGPYVHAGAVQVTLHDLDVAPYQVEVDHGRRRVDVG